MLLFVFFFVLLFVLLFVLFSVFLLLVVLGRGFCRRCGSRRRALRRGRVSGRWGCGARRRKRALYSRGGFFRAFRSRLWSWNRARRRRSALYSRRGFFRAFRSRLRSWSRALCCWSRALRCWSGLLNLRCGLR